MVFTETLLTYFNVFPIEFEVYDMVLYENVSQVQEYRRKTLVLIGPQYIGRKSLKGRLIADNPTGFGQVMPCE